MSRGRASVLAPANQPLFEGQLIRNPTRVNLPPGGGGISEFPFQFSWPGLVNFAGDQSPRIPTFLDLTLTGIYTTFITPGSTIQYRVMVNASIVATVTRSTSGAGGLLPTTVAPGDLIGIDMVSIGAGGNSGMWIGISAEPA